MSVVVRVLPPNTSASERILYPTDSGPMATLPLPSPRCTMEPPPRPMLQVRKGGQRGAA